MLLLGSMAFYTPSSWAGLSFPGGTAKYEGVIDQKQPIPKMTTAEIYVSLKKAQNTDKIEILANAPLDDKSDENRCRVYHLIPSADPFKVSLQCVIKNISGKQNFQTSISYQENGIKKNLAIAVSIELFDKLSNDLIIRKMLAEFPNPTKLIQEVLKPKCLKCEADRAIIRNENKKNVAKLFRKSEAIEFKLDVNLELLLKTSAEARVPTPIPGSLTLGDKKLDIEVEKRGKSRGVLCTFLPPMKIRFKSDKKETVFEGAGKTLKLVFPCYNQGTRYGTKNSNFDEMLNREYWVYKIIEASGMPHFKVRRAIVKIGGKKTPAFFIEDYEDVVAREGGQIDKKGDMSKVRDEMRLYNLLSASSDSSASGHNSKTYLGRDNLMHQARYDFDLSPLVGTDWNNFGYGISTSELKEISQLLGTSAKGSVAKILSHQGDMMNVIEESDLSVKDKIRFKEYYEAVFKALKEQSEFFP